MRIAVIGSGVSGLGATWALNEYSDHQVDLYEADSRPGGHSNTVSYPSPKKKGTRVNVDTGFIVCNPPSYPNFLRFLKLINVPTVPTEMTFAVTRDRGQFEWAGDTVFTVFCQTKNLFRMGHWRMIWDVLRFNACARSLVEEDGEDEYTRAPLSIGDYLTKEGYSESFRDDYLIPMTAAIWSTPPDKCSLDFPARTLLRFMYNHHLLQLTGKPAWLTIPGGSHTYVKKVLSRLPASQLHLSTPIKAISTLKDSEKNTVSVSVETVDGAVETYDAVILATHSNTALNMLRNGGRYADRSGVTKEEVDVLSAFSWSRNEAVLHSDEELMPKNRAAWSCWNYLTFSDVDDNGVKQGNVNQVALTYCMNHLQHIPESEFGPVLVTLNPPYEPRPETVAGRWTYEHPVLSAESVKAQSLLHTIQNKRGITFAGAWTKYGFHEDGFTSGIRTASDHFGAKLPFDIRSPDRIGVRSAREVRLAGVMGVLEEFRIFIVRVFMVFYASVWWPFWVLYARVKTKIM